MGKAAWSRVSTHRIIVGTASAFMRSASAISRSSTTSRMSHGEGAPSGRRGIRVDRRVQGVDGRLGQGQVWTGCVRVRGQYQSALIPVDLKEQIGFTSGVGAAVANQSGDLVAGKTNVDGSFVVEAVLCKDSPGLFACAKQYERGYFDADTGLQLTRKFTPMVPGRRIDVSSYKVLD